MYTLKYIPNKRIVFAFFLLGLFCNTHFYSQQFQLKIDSSLVNNFQIEMYGEENKMYISEEGNVEIPFEKITKSDSIKIIDLEKNKIYNLFKDEIKNLDGTLFFSSGKVIETVSINRKKNRFSLGILDSGASSKLYMLPDLTKIVEIPDVSKYKGKQIKKIVYYVSGGKHPVSKEKFVKENSQIIPILYTCESVDCKDKYELIPNYLVGFSGNKYLEIDLRHHNIVINDQFVNIYVGFSTVEQMVFKMKNVKRIGDNKCYNVEEKYNWFKEATYHCPIVFLEL